MIVYRCRHIYLRRVTCWRTWRVADIESRQRLIYLHTFILIADADNCPTPSRHVVVAPHTFTCSKQHSHCFSCRYLTTYSPVRRFLLPYRSSRSLEHQCRSLIHKLNNDTVYTQLLSFVIRLLLAHEIAFVSQDKLAKNITFPLSNDTVKFSHQQLTGVKLFQTAVSPKPQHRIRSM